MSDGKSILGLISPEVQNKIYNDGLAKPVKEAGDIAENVMKSVHLVLAPFQLMALAQDRIVKWMEKIRAEVPEKRQVQAAPEIAGPILRDLVFIADENKLKDLYLNLLKAAVDSEKRDLVHPRFALTLSNMSWEDAILFQQILIESRKAGSVQIRLPAENGLPVEIWALNHSSIHIDELASVSHGKLRMSVDLLSDLGLITILTRDNIAGIDIRWTCVTTIFGRLFAQVCLPDDVESQ